jgi:hypothetical protein
MTASRYTSPPQHRTVADYLLECVREGLSAAQAGNNLAFVIQNGFIAVEPPIPPRARVREMAGDRFFIETADALIPAEHFRYRKLRPQDYLREDWFSDPWERYGVDVAPPVRPQPAKVKALPAKHGTQERSEWKEIVPHLKALFDVGKLPNPNAAFHAISNWLAAKRTSMAKSTIQNGIKRHCDWWK